MNHSSSIRVRFPPSPTGLCHVGTARMGIVNYLFAKRQGGTIIFRSEDTDKERSKREYEDDIIEQLRWLGLSWDEFYRTTELVQNHTRALHKLIAEDKAYISREESKKEPGVMVEVVRLRNPGRSVTFTDLIRGDITFDTTELGDFTIARSVHDPIYHFAVVVDDGDMGITHVIRGDDHISNTPRQILIQEALGYPRPAYAHYPLLLGADKSKLSKRTGDVAVKSYRDQGYLSDALFNYIALLGWTPPSEREILSREEMIAEFAIEDLHKSGAVFDMEKLNWFNREYILRTPVEVLQNEVINILEEELGDKAHGQRDLLVELVPLVRERMHTYGDVRTLCKNGEFDFFFTAPSISKESIPEKKSTPEDARRHLMWISEQLEKATDFSPESIKTALWDYASQEGRGSVLWPFRYSLSGRERSPDPFVIASLIGKEESLLRIRTALALLT